MVERCLPNRFPIWRRHIQSKSFIYSWNKYFLSIQHVPDTLKYPNPPPTRGSHPAFGQSHQRQQLKTTSPSLHRPNLPQMPGIGTGSHLQVGDKKQDSTNSECWHGQEKQQGRVWNHQNLRWGGVIATQTVTPPPFSRNLALTCSKPPTIPGCEP